MASVNKKQLIAIVAIILVTNGITATVIVHNNNSSKSDAKVKNTGAAFSPTSVLKQPSQYTGQVISVKGTIVHSAAGYYVVGSEKKSPGALQLDFSKTKLDPTSYVVGPDVPTAQPTAPTDGTPPPAAPAAPTSDSAKVTTKGPYTVTGKLSQIDPAKPIVFVVESIK